MRVILMHNPSAGSEDHTARDLMRKIREAEHEVIAGVTGRKELSEALRKPCDLVVVAGGDGTVHKAAGALAGTGVPFTILPLGTANNIARTLGLIGGKNELIESWSRSEIRGFDRGSILHEEETTGFIEAFGLGIFPEIIRAAKKLGDPDDPDEKLQRDLEIFQSMLEQAEPASYTISADGEDLSGDYLMIEVMNIPSLGPHIPLTPPSVPGDGALELILVGEAERGALVRHIAKIRREKTSKVKLPLRQVRHVVISCGDRRYHRDGSILDGAKKETRTHFEVKVEPHALQVLCPRG